MNYLCVNINVLSCIAAVASAVAAIVSLYVAILAHNREKRICFGAQLSAKLEPAQNKDATHKLTIYNDGNGSARKIFATLNDGHFIDNECYNPNDLQVTTVSIDLLRKGECKDYNNIRIEPIPELKQIYLTIEWVDDYKKKNQKRFEL